MGWDVDDTGLGVVFDRSIPEFVRAHFRSAIARMLRAADIPLRDITRFVCHPGGTKVPEAIEETMALPSGSLDAERRVLQTAGNMSAPSVLFVLSDVLAQGHTGRMALAALGPGFTASCMPFTVRTSA